MWNNFTILEEIFVPNFECVKFLCFKLWYLYCQDIRPVSKQIYLPIRPKGHNFMTYFIYPTDAQIECSKSVKIYIKIYIRGAPTCFGFLQPSSGNYSICFAKVIIINNQLKYVVYDVF
jgi:hypothetical protein